MQVSSNNETIEREETKKKKKKGLRGTIKKEGEKEDRLAHQRRNWGGSHIESSPGRSNWGEEGRPNSCSEQGASVEPQIKAQETFQKVF